MDKSDNHKPLIGLQNSVLALVDPFHKPELSHRLRRTGEGVDMPVQDGAPSRNQFIELLKTFGVDFLLQHTMPFDDEQLSFINSMADLDMKFMLGNEFGSINRIGFSGTNRGDFSDQVVHAAKQQEGFLGLLYDETEHIQLHPNIYQTDKGKPTTWQWADPSGKTLDEIEIAVTDAVHSRVTESGCSLYSEHVFPLMYHTFARGGMNPVPKVMKEEYQSLQLASALGAAVQYSRKFGICADLWGSDTGNWFTRKWGFPGHSPEDFENALNMAWHFAPDFLFVENVDALIRFSPLDGFKMTEFGEIFYKFVHEYIPAHPLPYRFCQAHPDIALVRSDDCLFDRHGGFSGHKMYGSLDLPVDDQICSVFRAWSLLSHRRIPEDGPIILLPPPGVAKHQYPVTPETIGQLPLEHGVVNGNRRNEHDLFYPMHGVMVYDQFARENHLSSAELIVAAGSRMTSECAQAMLTCAYQGATLVSAPWLMPSDYRTSRKLGSGRLLISESYAEDDLVAQIAHLLGDPKVWIQRFGKYKLEVRNETGDGIQLDIRIIK